MSTCTRRLEFDAAHRVMRHESKCVHLHGHRYSVEVSVHSPELDGVGRVVDFGVVKERIGSWIDSNLDHGTLLNREDQEISDFLRDKGHKVYLLDGNPTAEVLAYHLKEVSQSLLPDGLSVIRVRVYETPNCWADA